MTAGAVSLPTAFVAARHRRRSSTLTSLRAVARAPLGCELAGAVLIVVSAIRPWVQPDLHKGATVSAARGAVARTLCPLPWSVALAGAFILVLALIRFRSWSWRCGVILTLGTILVDVPVSLTRGSNGLAEQVRSDRSDAAVLARAMGYHLLRPNVTSIGPVHVSAGAGVELSALRSGYYLCLAALALVVLGAVASRSQTPRSRLSVRSGFALVGALGIVLAVDAVVLVRDARETSRVAQAATRAESGDCRSAIPALAGPVRDGTATARAATDYGRCLQNTAPVTNPFVLLAQSRAQLSDGNDRSALVDIRDAVQALPTNPILRAEARSQLVDFVLRHRSAGFARTVVPSAVDSAPLRLLLARFDLGDGRYDAALLDADRARQLAGDDDVRSAALTLAGLATTATGDDVRGRELIVSAITADHDQVNVVARSVGTGLYTADLGGSRLGDDSLETP